jgi:hypothetical protein
VVWRATAKLFVSAVTGSSAMLTEGVHSLVATGNEFLLLCGGRRNQSDMDVLVFTVFVEDSPALPGIAIADLGLGLSHALRNPASTRQPPC